MKIELIDDHHCFACGSENEKGLKIHWRVQGRTTLAEFVPEREHQGWKGIVHGGILATLLDEAMTRLAWCVYGCALTAEMTIRYVATAKVGEKLTIAGHLSDEDKRIVTMKAWLFRDGSSPNLSSLHLPPELAHLQTQTLVAHSQGKALKI
ncbi:MAG: PaaI family thioesterase [Elusimicrobia bacterium]|nr:PaaI family thioesterase [Elusimicrobiota bacterium]